MSVFCIVIFLNIHEIAILSPSIVIFLGTKNGWTQAIVAKIAKNAPTATGAFVRIVVNIRIIIVRDTIYPPHIE